jgi:amidase
MSLNSVDTAYEGQVSLLELRSVASKLGIPLKPKDEPDMLVLLQSLDEQMKALAALPDFQEDPDISSFPRKDIVVTPKGRGNLDGAWACRCEIKGDDKTLENGILKGGSVCIKDNIAVAGVPCLFGTNVFDDWIPKTDATLVARILKAGGLITGKAVCENLCMTG